MIKSNKQKHQLTEAGGGWPHDVMVKALAGGIIVSEFELQSCYYIHFRTNTLGKGMNPPYPPNYGLNSITAVLFF